MAYLKAVNVGQGDCFVIRPYARCKYRDHVFFVDLGDGQVDVTKEINDKDKVHLIITHHHEDHINGIKYFFDRIDQVQEVIIPYNFNEITLLAKAILNLKGMKSAVNSREYIDGLNDIVSEQKYLKKLFGGRAGFKFVCDGISLCNHLKFLNPPMPDYNLSITKEEREEFKPLVEELFEPEFASSLIGYVDAVGNGSGVDHTFYRDFIQGDTLRTRELRIQEGRIDEERFRRDNARSVAGCRMVMDFIIGNQRPLFRFNNNPGRMTLERVYNNYKEQTHDVCLVMLAECQHDSDSKKFLLTGDASKRALKRIVKDNTDIRVDYLKVPHHGSKNNLTLSILNAIQPSVAIISHKNGLFGRAKDPHPNRETLNMLKSKNITIYVTNDVVKKNINDCPKKVKINDSYLEIE